MEIIALTPSAIEQAKKLLTKEQEGKSEAANAGLRVSVVGGGCSGLQYDLKFSEPEEDDTVYEYSNGLKVLVDQKSALFLMGSKLEFYSDLEKIGFEVVNPNAVNTCGCGKSFS